MRGGRDGEGGEELSGVIIPLFLLENFRRRCNCHLLFQIDKQIPKEVVIPLFNPTKWHYFIIPAKKKNPLFLFHYSSLPPAK